MVQTLAIPEWGIHINTELPIFIFIGVRKNDEPEDGEEFGVYIGISLANTEEEALDKVPKDELDSFDAFGAYSLFGILKEAILLDKAEKIIDAVKHKK